MSADLDNLTPKMARLLDYLAEYVGPYSSTRLRIGDAMVATALRRRGLVTSAPSGPSGKATVWSVTTKGQRLAEERRGVK